MNNAKLKTQQLIDAYNDPVALTHIYNPEVNLAIWNRGVDDKVIDFSQQISCDFQSYQLRFRGNLMAIKKHLQLDLPSVSGRSDFINDVVLLVDMFSELMDIHKVGLRLAVLTKAMCPKFHVDRVPARLMTTYCGKGTEWVDNAHVCRSEGGAISVPDSAPICHLVAGQVALMKGELWEGNENRALVHRSPTADAHSPRCVLTLDCS